MRDIYEQSMMRSSRETEIGFLRDIGYDGCLHIAVQRQFVYRQKRERGEREKEREREGGRH